MKKALVILGLLCSQIGHLAAQKLEYGFPVVNRELAKAKDRFIEITLSDGSKIFSKVSQGKTDGEPAICQIKSSPEGSVERTLKLEVGKKKFTLYENDQEVFNEKTELKNMVGTISPDGKLLYLIGWEGIEYWGYLFDVGSKSLKLQQKIDYIHKDYKNKGYLGEALSVVMDVATQKVVCSFATEDTYVFDYTNESEYLPTRRVSRISISDASLWKEAVYIGIDPGNQQYVAVDLSKNIAETNAEKDFSSSTHIDYFRRLLFSFEEDGIKEEERKELLPPFPPNKKKIFLNSTLMVFSPSGKVAAFDPSNSLPILSLDGETDFSKSEAFSPALLDELSNAEKATVLLYAARKLGRFDSPSFILLLKEKLGLGLADFLNIEKGIFASINTPTDNKYAKVGEQYIHFWNTLLSAEKEKLESVATPNLMALYDFFEKVRPTCNKRDCNVPQTDLKKALDVHRALLKEYNNPDKYLSPEKKVAKLLKEATELNLAGKSDKALLKLNEALEIAPNNFDVKYETVLAYFGAGQKDVALQKAVELYAFYPSNPDVNFILFEYTRQKVKQEGADENLAKQLIERAKSFLSVKKEASQGVTDAQHSIADMELFLKDRALYAKIQALKEAEVTQTNLDAFKSAAVRLESINPASSAVLYTEIGKFYQKKGEQFVALGGDAGETPFFDMALENLNKAEKLGEPTLAILESKANLLTKRLDKTKEAYEWIAELEKTHPNLPSIKNFKYDIGVRHAASLYNEQNYQAAAQVFGQLESPIGRERNKFLGLLYQGMTHYQLKQYGQAKTALLAYRKSAGESILYQVEEELLPVFAYFDSGSGEAPVLPNYRKEKERLLALNGTLNGLMAQGQNGLIQARLVIDEVLAGFTEMKNPYLLAQATNNLAEWYLRTNDLVNAQAKAREAELIEKFYFQAYLTQASAQYDARQYQKAEETLERLRKIKLQDDDKKRYGGSEWAKAEQEYYLIGILSEQLAAEYISAQKWEKASTQAFSGITALNKLKEGNSELKGNLYYMWGVSEYKKGNLSDAKKQLRNAINFNSKWKSDRSVQAILNK